MVWRRKMRRERSCGSSPLSGRRRKSQSFIAAAIEQCEPRYLLSITAPSNIPTTVFNITSYGAVDTSANNVTAIQAAINAAAANKVNGFTGGIVEIPAAAQAWLSGPLTMASNVDIQIDAGAELQALTRTNWIASYSASTGLITGNHLTNFEITGSGIIDGNGGGGSGTSSWWDNSSSTRPDLIHIQNSNTLLISGVTIQNSPKEHVTLDAVTNVIINGITISAPSTSPNTDGIDPAGSNILIENCNVSDGDDDIVIKPQSTFCSNITITNCTIGAGHGISVGGETNDGLNGMTVTDITFNGTTDGLRLKAGRGSGGLVENVTYSNITMTNVEYPFYITSYYLNGSDTQPSNPATDPGQTVTSTTPIWENITFSNITSTDAASNSSAGILYAVPEEPMTNIVFDNVKITAHSGMEINNARNVSFGDGSKITVSSGNDLIATSSVPTPYNDTIVPEGYADADIGSPATVSTTLFDPDTSLYSVIAAGTGIGGASDQFNFASTSITGDAIYFAKVTSLSTANTGAVAGVMFGDSTDTATSAFADAVVTPGSGVEFQWRNSNSGTTGSASVTGIAAPVYLEVVRSGSNFSAWYSTDGTSWTQIGTTQTIIMSSTALVGLAVSSGTSSATSTATFSNFPGPTLTAGPTASPQPVTGTTANLSVAASETGSSLTYTWSAISVPAGVATPTFSVNGASAAENTTVTFFGAGIYQFLVTITDSNNVSATALLGVAVNQTPTNITVTPASATVAGSGTEVFTAAATDQFGVAAPVTIFAWSLTSGVGTVNSSFGLYTSPATAGAATVEATAGSASATATVNSTGPTVTQTAAADPNPVTGTTTNLTAAGSENGSGSGLNYTWSATSVPNGVAAPTYSVNGTNAAASTIATFFGAGNYSFLVTIT
ncbi:MAG TPA: glycosyl hydrolase family 28 protein, partial [Tepidisphaeraceae bacterium]|nr:glycosyl hydrolase family 28 protein [Tepidisphaeraceae bacterium]